MEINKDKLRENIEQIVADGVVNGEEVDATAENIMDEISIIIRAAELYNNYIYDAVDKIKLVRDDWREFGMHEKADAASYIIGYIKD